MTEVVPGIADLDIERIVFDPPILDGHNLGTHSPSTSGLFG